MIDTTKTDKSPVKLSELTKEIADVINGHFGHKFYWVIAEITSHRFVTKNGYHFFDLSEKHGPAQANLTKISCTAFSVGSEAIRNFESYTRQKFGNSIEVMVKIKVDYSIEYGLRTILQDIDVAFTIGNLEKLKQQVLARLLRDEVTHIQKVGEQYITTNKKLFYPGIIKGIALITSKESEGYADFCHTLVSNPYGYQFHLFKFFCKVQAETAGDEIIDCLKTIFTKYRPYVDVVVICRGGGAQTDFLAFNQYNISRAVARFPIPIITGIGHHRNQSLVDLLVRTETKTPTQAAEFIINHCHTSEINVQDLQKSITVNAQRITAIAQSQLTEAQSQVINRTRDLVKTKCDQVTFAKSNVIGNASRFLSKHKDEAGGFYNIVVSNTYRLVGDHKQQLVKLSGLITIKPSAIVSIWKNELANQTSRLRSFTNKYLINQDGYLVHYKTLFKHLDIEKTLAKGFAIIRKDGKVIADASQISISDKLDIQLKQTIIETKVLNKKNGTGSNL